MFCIVGDDIRSQHETFPFFHLILLKKIYSYMNGLDFIIYEHFRKKKTTLKRKVPFVFNNNCAEV